VKIFNIYLLQAHSTLFLPFFLALQSASSAALINSLTDLVFFFVHLGKHTTFYNNIMEIILFINCSDFLFLRRKNYLTVRGKNLYFHKPEISNCLTGDFKKTGRQFSGYFKYFTKLLGQVATNLDCFWNRNLKGYLRHFPAIACLL